MISLQRQSLASWGGLWFVVVLAACCRSGNSPDSVATAPAQPQVVVSNTAAPALAALAGKWQRPDGGYVLHVVSVQADGKVDAQYLNPDPIKVSRAVALREGEDTKLFIELRDVNYPGCTYSLKHDSKADQLFGQYFQAALGETYDVVFARIRD